MKAFEKMLQFVTEKMAWVAIAAILGCTALVVTDVIRYQAVNKPVPGAHEVVELIAAVILSMGIGYLTFVRGHVSVGLLVDLFRPRVQAVFDLFNSVVSLAFTLWLTEGVVEMALRNYRLRVGDGGFGNSQGSFYVLDCRVAGTHMRGPFQGLDPGCDGDSKRRLRWSVS